MNIIEENVPLTVRKILADNLVLRKGMICKRTLEKLINNQKQRRVEIFKKVF